MSKTTTLSAEQWKALCLLNVTQLHNFLQTVPGNMEGGTPGMNPERIGAVSVHLEELGRFMNAWSKARQGEAAKAAEAQPAPADEATAEVIEPPKRRSGWPKGKPRKPKEVIAEH